MHKGVNVGHQPCSPHQGCAHSLGHPCGIVEGVLDGHVVVIGDGSQKTAISYTQGKKVHLGEAASQGGRAGVTQRIGQHLGTVIEVKQRPAKDRWARRK